MQDDKVYLRRRRIVSVVSVVSLVVFIIAFGLILGKPIVEFLDDREGFREWANSGLMGRFALLGIMVIQVIIALIPGGVVEVAAGYCYGSIEGAIICIVGACIGSAMVFWLSRKFGVPFVEAFISREKLESLSFMKDERKLSTLLFVLYLIPGTPKDVFNYFVGITPIKFKTFIPLCMTARIPAILMTTVGADAAFEGDYFAAVIVFAVTAVLSVGGMLLYRAYEKRKNGKPNE